VGGGVEAAADFIRHPTTAVIAYNDRVAIAVMRELTAAGGINPAGCQRRGLRQHLRRRTWSPRR
jgi:DNA-binding LacI/PurR family transcriptional regulator